MSGRSSNLTGSEYILPSDNSGVLDAGKAWGKNGLHKICNYLTKCAPENASAKMLACPALLFVTVVGHVTLKSPIFIMLFCFLINFFDYLALITANVAPLLKKFHIPCLKHRQSFVLWTSR